MLKPIESDVVNLLTAKLRRVLDALEDIKDIQSMYAELGMDTSLTNADLDAGNFKFTKAQLTDALGVITALGVVLDATAKAKLYRVAQARKLR